MPRRHKEPPHETIDSILLAISRREDLSVEMVPHYFDRLGEEWISGARDKVLNLLRSNDTSAHAAAVFILSELASEFDLEELEEFISDPTVGDMGKLALAPVLRRLGSEITDERIVEYLNDPGTAMLQMQRRLFDMMGHNERSVEAILSDVVDMPPPQRQAFIEWMCSCNDPRAVHLLIPLLEEQPVKIVLTVIKSLEKIGPAALKETLPALDHLVKTTTNRTIKQQARSALGHLTMLTRPGEVETILSDAQALPFPPHEARVSSIDSSGSQLILLSWKRPDGKLKGVNILCQEGIGIKDCYGIDAVLPQQWSEQIKNVGPYSFYSTELSFPYACAMVLEARAGNKRSRRKLPAAYTIWRPLIEQSAQDKVDELKLMLQSQPLDPAAVPLVWRGHELYREPEFIPWLYPAGQALEPFVRRFWSKINVDNFSTIPTGDNEASLSPAVPFTDQEHERLVNDLVSEALTTLADARWCSLIEARLLLQAALFQIQGHTVQATLARAVAAALRPDSPIPVQEQPFLRMLMQLSIVQAPLTAMVESMDTTGNLTLPTFRPEK